MNADEIRRQIRKSHLFQYQVARQLNVCEMTLIHWLRDLTPDRATTIQKAIREITAERRECVNG